MISGRFYASSTERGAFKLDLFLGIKLSFRAPRSVFVAQVDIECGQFPLIKRQRWKSLVRS